MKQLKFEQKLVEPILASEKTATWRLYDDKNLSVDDELSCKQGYRRAVRAGADHRRAKTTLGEIDLSNVGGHETYESREAMYEKFREYYGEQVGFDTEVKIVSFVLVDTSSSK